MTKFGSSVRFRLVLLAVLAVLAFGLYLWPGTGLAAVYILRLRLQKLLAYALVAIMTAYATLSFQTVTENRFLTPSILGLESLYTLLQSVYLFLYWQWSSTQNPNPIVEFVVVLALQLGFFACLQPAIGKLLAKGFGVILLICLSLGTLFSSLSTFFQVLMSPNEYDKLQSKLFASFQNINTNLLGVAAVIAALAIVFLWQRQSQLDVLLLGKAQATLLGVPVQRLQNQVLWIVVILTATSTSLLGPMPFFGFMVANLIYQLLKTYRHSQLFLGASLLGFLMLVGGQWVLERLLNYNVTISMLVSLFGGAFFFYLLYKERIKS